MSLYNLGEGLCSFCRRSIIWKDNLCRFCEYCGKEVCPRCFIIIQKNEYRCKNCIREHDFMDYCKSKLNKSTTFNYLSEYLKYIV